MGHELLVCASPIGIGERGDLKGAPHGGEHHGLSPGLVQNALDQPSHMPVVGAVLPRQADMPPIRRLLDADALGEEPAKIVIHDFDYICPHTAAQIHMGLGTLLQGEPLGVMEPKPRGDPVRFLACKNSLHPFHFVHTHLSIS